MNTCLRIGAVGLLVASCGLTEPTYIDVPPWKQAEIAKDLGVDVKTMLNERLTTLRNRLTEELGVEVQKIEKRENGTVVAVVEPVSDEIGRAVADKVGRNPTSAGNWIAAGFAAVGLIGSWLVGARGKGRKKNAGC